MKLVESSLEPELEALLNPGKIERIAPPAVRARALGRARAIIAAGGRIPIRAPLELVSRSPVNPVPVRSSVRFVLPASFAAAAVAIGAVTALRSPPARLPPTRVSTLAPSAAAAVPESVEEALPPAQTAVIKAVSPLKPARPEQAVGSSELELLARAQAAYMHRDFARAITLIGELTRRFPNGHLAEEREALRVRSLFGVGSAEEGRRAAAAFANRFPRSVLLPKEGKIQK